VQASLSIAGAAPAAPLAADPALSLAAVVEALRRFFVAVSSPDALPEFAGIQSPRLRGDAVSRCVANIARSGDYCMVARSAGMLSCNCTGLNVLLQ
jgi:hypothetical protein